MSTDVPIFTGAFPGGVGDVASRDGHQPVIFDILGPDRETSVLPDEWKLVLHVNPSSMKMSYSKKIERIQTKGGWVEQHWGDDAQNIAFSASTGSFMRLYSGLSNTTSTAYGGSRRETLAYDSYLDWLAMFHSNGSVYDFSGQIAFQGIIQVTFAGGVYRGWFTQFSVSETAENPYSFQLTCAMDIAEEVQVWRSAYGGTQTTSEAYAEAYQGGIASNVHVGGKEPTFYTRGTSIDGTTIGPGGGPIGED